jgi:hypothetical protein
MRTIEVKVYKFEELQKDVQEKVIESWYEHEDYPLLYDDLVESLLSDDDNIFNEGFTLSYSLSGSQGDGLSIKGDINIEKVMLKCSKKLQKQFKDKIHSIYSTGNTTNHYSYAHKRQIEFELDIPSDIDEIPFYKTFETEILPDIQDMYMDLCNKLEKEGYDVIEYRMDIDEFTDHAEANGYAYYSNGKMV